MRNNEYAYDLCRIFIDLICSNEAHRLMLQIRPTEVKAVSDLLSQEHESVDELARSVIELIDGMRAKRETYVLVQIEPSLSVAKAIGPYATFNQAMKDIPTKLSRYDERSRAYLAKLHDPCMIDIS